MAHNTEPCTLCSNLAWAKGLCWAHYQKQRRAAQVKPPKAPAPPREPKEPEPHPCACGAIIKDRHKVCSTCRRGYKRLVMDICPLCNCRRKVTPQNAKACCYCRDRDAGRKD